MFIGHMAVGLASKRVAPAASLGVLIAAPLMLDLLWPIFLLMGLETVRVDPGNTAFTPLNFVSYPFSHSLTFSALWGAIFGFLYWAVTRYARGGIVVSVSVISHWVLDAVTHRPDLPLTTAETTKIGLGLWNSVPLTMILETILFAASVWLYGGVVTDSRDRIGRYGFWAFVAFSLVSYISNIFGPPPPNADFLAKFAFSLWIFVVWAWWFDGHRKVRT
jgi:membrane-bound metal-dependent hydrolase YbcI (DUF457 family)